MTPKSRNQSTGLFTYLHKLLRIGNMCPRGLDLLLDAVIGLTKDLLCSDLNRRRRAILDLYLSTHGAEYEALGLSGPLRMSLGPAVATEGTMSSKKGDDRAETRSRLPHWAEWSCCTRRLHSQLL